MEKIQFANAAEKSIKGSKLSLSLALSLFLAIKSRPADLSVCVPHPHPAQPSQIIAGSFTIPNPKFQSTSNCLLFDQLNDRRAISRTFWIWYSRTKKKIGKIEKRFPFEKRRRLQRTDNIQSALEYTNYVWVLCQASGLYSKKKQVPNCLQAYFKCFWCM